MTIAATPRDFRAQAIERARRTFCRRIAAAIIEAMAETDMDFDKIDDRTEMAIPSASVISALVSGPADNISLREIAEIAWAIGCEPIVRMNEIRWQGAGATADAEGAA